MLFFILLKSSYVLFQSFLLRKYFSKKLFEGHDAEIGNKYCKTFCLLHNLKQNMEDVNEKPYKSSDLF